MGALMTPATLNTVGMAVDFLANPGNDCPNPTKWQQDANPWTLIVTSTLGCESFHYWTGQAITTEPTLSDLIDSLLCDARSLEDFEDLSYSTGKAIEANCAKAQRLFGDLWPRMVAHYDEDDIAAAFGRFS